MSEFTDLRLPVSGLHPSHFAALRTEIMRTGAELSPDQLRNLTDDLRSLTGPGQPVETPDAPTGRVGDGSRAFAGTRTRP